MGSYCSVCNNTNSTMYIKYGVNMEALGIAGFIVSIIGIPFTGGQSLALGIIGGGITISSFIFDNVDKKLKREGYSKINPGNVYKSEKVSLSLYFQANVVLVEKINDKKVKIKVGKINVWSGPTDNSCNEYNATDGSYDEQIITE